ncbi:MAG: adenylate/guanylate cyclase domain-containing protein, partial [Candidatus Gracilibacteria bacterium]
MKFTKNRNGLAVLLSIIIFGIVFIISRASFLYILDKNVGDLYFTFSDIPVNKDIVIVEIDEDTLSGRKNSIGDITLEGLGRFPFDRKYYGTVIDNLNNAGAAVIALDIILGEKSNDKSDDILSESIKNAGNVIMGLWTDSAGYIQSPYEKFGKHMLVSGFFAPELDKITDTVYSIEPIKQFEGSNNIYNHFSIAIIKGFYSKIYDDEKYLNEQIISRPDKFIIANKLELIKAEKNKNEVLINYTDSHKFTKVSFLDVYLGQIDENLFKDKIIIVGPTAKGIKDVFNTPIGIEYGVYTHANMINTILTKSGIKYFDKNIEWLMIFLLIIVSVYFNISRSSYVLLFSNVALVSLFLIGIIFIPLITSTLFNYSIEFTIALVISLALSNIVKYLVENKNKIKLNKALSEYVSEDVAKEILSGEGKINLDGENKDVAIFFSDIEGFTSISEKFGAEELVGFLREYLSEMSNIIMDEKGFVNKYEGDAIMALWGVF